MVDYDLPYIGNVSDVDTIIYPVKIFIDRIKPTSGSSKTGKAYSVTELDEIMLGLFGFKCKTSNGKRSAYEFLMLPENIRVIQRNNERLQERERERAIRGIANTPRS